VKLIRFSAASAQRELEKPEKSSKTDLTGIRSQTP